MERADYRRKKFYKADFNRRKLIGFGKSGIRSRQKMLDIAKEIFRKSIHLCSAFIPLLLKYFYIPVMILLFLVLVFYTICELLRLKGTEIPVISTVTAAAARKRDENRFVLGPVTLVCGILISALLWDLKAATIGIFALAFGDGLASLAGKLFGRVRIPLTNGKTAAGSLTCFTAIFISCYLAGNNCSLALIIASFGMLIEVLPLKDFDNVLIPFILGGIAQFYLHM